MPTPGSLEVISGPMFSGKSEELIRRLRRAQIARLTIKIFKHHFDNRYCATDVVSHSQWRLPSVPVKNATDILSSIESGTGVVGIDEGQFFDETLVSVAQDLVGRGTRVIVAGLDLDCLGQPFGPMPHLLAMAEEVTKLHAICIQCGSPAHFSQRLVPGADRVMVGAREEYEARCRRCFAPTTSDAVAGSSNTSLSASNGEREKG